MKVFIIFSAIFMMGMTCMIYQGDVNVYMHEQETLKMIAEEEECTIITTFDGLMNPMPSPERFVKEVIRLESGGEVDLDELAQNMFQAGSNLKGKTTEEVFLIRS